MCGPGGRQAGQASRRAELLSASTQQCGESSLLLFVGRDWRQSLRASMTPIRYYRSFNRRRSQRTCQNAEFTLTVAAHSVTRTAAPVMVKRSDR